MTRAIEQILMNGIAGFLSRASFLFLAFMCFFFSIIAQNSVRTRLNHLRAKKILVTAMKQSLRDVLPTLNSPIKLSSYLDSIDSSLDSFIATCLIDDIDLLSNRLTKGNNSQILIGPEGGFTQNELDLAKKANFTPVSLSDNRLRTETAGVVSCSIFSIIN